jgi:hypothetical protein
MTTQAQEHTPGVEAGCPQMTAAVKQGRGIEQGCYLEIERDRLCEVLLDCIEGFRDTAERDNGGLYPKANNAYVRALNLLKPYPFCTGNPTLGDCIKAGYCKREIACNN